MHFSPTGRLHLSGRRPFLFRVVDQKAERGASLLTTLPSAGVIFLTLEDETGTSNLVVWKMVYEACRKAVITGRLLRTRGRMERDGPVMHLIAEHVEDMSPLLSTLGRQVIIPSNDRRPDETKRPIGDNVR